MEDLSLEITSLNCGVCGEEFPTNELHSIKTPKLQNIETLICSNCLNSFAENFFTKSVDIIDILKISTQINQTDSERLNKIIALMVQYGE
jgi:hypothetical protein